jgi:hypothetical protein
MSADIADITKFVEELKGAAKDARSEARKVVTKGALNIKRDAVRTLRGQTARGGSSLDWLPIAVGYDITSGGDVTEAEIGPDQGISGLGRGVEFGSSHHAPMPFLLPAFDREAPKFLDALTTAVVGAFGKL